MQFLSPKKFRMRAHVLTRRSFIRLGVVLLCILIVSHTKAQQERMVLFGITAQPLPKALDSLAKAFGIPIGFPVAETAKYHSVTIPAETRTLDKTLHLLLKNTTLKHRFLKGKVIVFKSQAGPGPATSDSLITVKGTVTDEAGQPLEGATILITGTAYGTMTDGNGQFILGRVPANGMVSIASIGYEKQSLPAITNIFIALKKTSAALQDVTINTGYQSIPKERATGSFDVISTDLINRGVSTNILDRLKGVSSGMFFNSHYSKAQTIDASGLQPNNLGFTIRGQNTIYANVNPLIVVDNFPYEGDINNINPNDIESVTILKDAAAASIWGARSGNGVIVITTKGGRSNEKMKVEFNSSITIANKPNLFYDKNYIKSSDYIDVESYLFDQGYFDGDLSSTTYPALSPVVKILSDEKNGLISEQEATNKLNDLRNNDVRNDISNYIYQKAVSQQYSLGLRGGTNNMTYQLSVGLDKNSDNLKRNGYDRLTINSKNTYKPFKNLELTTAINFSQNVKDQNNLFDYTDGGAYWNGNYNYSGSSIIPYLQLAMANGDPLAIDHNNINRTYIEQTAQYGFLDWSYRPLDEINHADNYTKVNDLLLRAALKYNILPFLNITLDYQNEKQKVEIHNNYSEETYYTRNTINTFAQYDQNNGVTNFIIPIGEIIQRSDYSWESNNLRTQLNYDQHINRNAITVIAGAEIRQRKTTGYTWGAYGYDPGFGTGDNAFDYTTYYPTNPANYLRIPMLSSGSTTGVLYRYLSYFTNAAYTYNNKYTVSISGRKDGSNIFGAKANDKLTPLWSAGLGWDVDKEPFYQIDWLPMLKLRATYGFNGNVYNGSAYLSGAYTVDGNTHAPIININNAPNPGLRWERIRNINIGLDFATKDNRVSGTVEWYLKNGKDLIEPTPSAPQTGFPTYMGNTANTRTIGTDITITSKNIQGTLNWNTTLLFSLVDNRLTAFKVPLTSQSISSFPMGVEGKPLNSIYSYKWAGLDPANGDPQGYLNGQISKDYAGIINNFSPDSLVYNGSALPTKFGSLRNDLSYKGFNLSFNILFELGYVFRESSIIPGYADIIYGGANADYENRWQRPGDEKNTNVPSLAYPSDPNRSSFYSYSSILVKKGDNIRLQDIRLSYDIRQLIKCRFFTGIQLYTYANNIGIIWKRNNDGIDPDYYASSTHTLTQPFSISFGITANF